MDHTTSVSAGAATGAAASTASDSTAFTMHGVPFTWDPAAVGLGGKAFTADTITGTFSLRGVSLSDGTDITHWYTKITGFSLNGHAVSPEGFGSNYGMYFDVTDKGVDGAPPDIVHFTSNDVTLKADPGNHNGALSADLSRVGFANTGPTGEDDDITLASGSRITGALNLDLAAGKLDSHFLGTFDPAARETKFFRSPSPHAQFDLERSSSNPAAGLTVTPQSDGTAITVVNDFVGTAQLVKAVHTSHGGMAFLDSPHHAGHTQPDIGASLGGCHGGGDDDGGSSWLPQRAYSAAGVDMRGEFGRWSAGATDDPSHGRDGSAWAGPYDQMQPASMSGAPHT